MKQYDQVFVPRNGKIGEVVYLPNEREAVIAYKTGEVYEGMAGKREAVTYLRVPINRLELV